MLKKFGMHPTDGSIVEGRWISAVTNQQILEVGIETSTLLHPESALPAAGALSNILIIITDRERIFFGITVRLY